MPSRSIISRIVTTLLLSFVLACGSTTDGSGGGSSDDGGAGTGGAGADLGSAGSSGTGGGGAFSGTAGCSRVCNSVCLVATDLLPFDRVDDCIRACEISGGFPCQEELIVALRCIEIAGCLDVIGTLPCQTAAVPYTECLSDL